MQRLPSGVNSFVYIILITLFSVAAKDPASGWKTIDKDPRSFGFQTSLPIGTEIWTIGDRNGLAGNLLGIVMWKTDNSFTIAVNVFGTIKSINDLDWRSLELSKKVGQKIWNGLPRVGDPDLKLLSKESWEARASCGITGWSLGRKIVTKNYRGERTNDHKDYLKNIEHGRVSYSDSDYLRTFFQKLQEELGVSLNEFVNKDSKLRKILFQQLLESLGIQLSEFTNKESDQRKVFLQERLKEHGIPCLRGLDSQLRKNISKELLEEYGISFSEFENQ